MASRFLKKHPEVIPLLGVVRDAEIAKWCGCCESTVWRMRFKLGIRKPGKQPMPSKLPETEAPPPEPPRAHVKWTPEEDAIIWKGVQNKTPVAELVEQLGRLRTYSSIENRKRTLRYREMRRCWMCEGDLPDGWKKSYCQACTEKQALKGKTRRERYQREGRCNACSDPIDIYGSLTMCSSCLAKNRSYQKRNHSGNTQGVVRWVGSIGLWDHLKRLPPEHGIVDLFGGAGSYTLKAAYQKLPILAYNEPNPGMLALMRVLRDGSLDELVKCIRSIQPMDPVLFTELYSNLERLPELQRAAVFFMAAQSAQKAGLASFEPKAKLYQVRKDLKRTLRRKVKALQGVKLRGQSWERVIEEFDAEDRVFFLDPPYPGTAFYQHNMDWSEHEYMIQRLLEIRGKFYMVCGMSRAAAILMKPLPYVYRIQILRGRYYIRELVGSNYPIPDLEPLDFAAYGL